MDAIEILREMHVEAKSAFQRIEQGSPDERGGLWAKLRPELVLHEQMEERFVYDPVTKDAGSDPVLSGWHEQHHQQVGEAEHMIEQIGRLEPRDQQFLQMVTQLRMALEQHIQREEGEIWPRIRQVWSSEKLEEAGRQVQASKAAGSITANISGVMGEIGEKFKDVA